MDGNSPLGRFAQSLRSLWNYSGSLAALALFAGVLAMGVAHLTRNSAGIEEEARFFRGVRNTREAEPPLGVEEISREEAASLPQYVKFLYDAKKLKSVVSLNHDGELEAPAGCRTAEQRLFYDEGGRLLRRENYDAQGRLCADASGVARQQFNYDSEGRLKESSFFNATGQHIEARGLGYSSERRAYDPDGRLAQREFLGKDGLPCLNRAGEQTVRYTYTPSGNPEKRRNYINGQLAEDTFGVAEEIRIYDGHDRLSRIEYRDARGQPSPCRKPAEGYAAAVLSYDSRGYCASVRYYDADGRLSDENGMNCAEWVCSHDGRGNPVYECYLDAEGQPCVPPAVGYAERMCSYDDANRPRREFFWDAEGRPGGSPARDGGGACYERRHEYAAGQETILSLHTDGSTSLLTRREGSQAESHGERISLNSRRDETRESRGRSCLEPGSSLAWASNRARSARKEAASPTSRPTATSSSASRTRNAARSETEGGGGTSPVARQIFARGKIHGSAMAARPIMTPETAVSLRTRSTSSGEAISPLPTTGTRQARAQASIILQSAFPPYCWLRVRPCTAMAAMPASSSL